MSAFFIAINRNQRPFKQRLAERMMSMLDRFGPDARTLHVNEHYALGYQSHWTVPEEVGEKQPLYDEATGKWLIFIGRIDNRDTLFALLNLSADSELSDAALVQRLVANHGSRFLDDIRGPYVLIEFDPSTGELLAARDPMGSRYLCYAISEEHILLASYEMAIVAHPSVAYELNDEKVARALMNEMEPVPTSAVNRVAVLKPGEVLTASTTGIKCERFYRPHPKRRIRYAKSSDYADEFKRLLRQAVQRRLRATGPVGTMLSGGMDSVPMTILAAQEYDDSLTAFSWVFDQYPQLDERAYSGPICQRFNIEQVCINCDEVWPKFDDDMHTNPVVPFGIPYSEFQQETFRQANARGVKILLTGIHGDLLYEQHDAVLYELLGAGRWQEAISELSRLWHAVPEKSQLIKYYLIKPLKVMQRLSEWRARFRPYPNDCLQDNIAKLLKPDPHWLATESRSALRPRQWQVVFDGFAGEDAALGRYMEAKFGVERRYPFRDRDLCEFMLAIPSDQLYFNLTKRPIVKNAFTSEFSDELLARNDKTNFTPVIDAGIDSDQNNRKWFKSDEMNWAYYVKQCYFTDKSPSKSAVNVIQWRCGYYDYWKSVCYNPLFCELGQLDKNDKGYE